MGNWLGLDGDLREAVFPAESRELGPGPALTPETVCCWGRGSGAINSLAPALCTQVSGLWTEEASGRWRVPGAGECGGVWMRTGSVSTAMGACSRNSGPARLGHRSQKGTFLTSQPFPTWRRRPFSMDRQAQERGPRPTPSPAMVWELLLWA